MSVLQALAWAALMLFGVKSIAWLVQRRLGNAGIVDGFWAWALGSLALWFAWVGSGPVAVRFELALMGGLWGLRLGSYLWRRNWRTAEDFRYAELRSSWGPQASARLFWFFQFQNLFTLALAGSAFAPAAWQTTSPGPWALALAGAVWLLAVGGEAIADAQMQAFKRRPDQHAQVCDVGLWRHSRHPNYFFECVHWLAYVPLSWGNPWWPVSLLAPLVMVLLLMRISGIPLLEARLVLTRPGYRDYMARTPALIPWRMAVNGVVRADSDKPGA